MKDCIDSFTTVKKEISLSLKEFLLLHTSNSLDRYVKLIKLSGELYMELQCFV